MKKIFCIVLVALILIMASVPCFADSVGFYNQLSSRSFPFVNSTVDSRNSGAFMVIRNVTVGYTYLSLGALVNTFYSYIFYCSSDGDIQFYYSGVTRGFVYQYLRLTGGHYYFVSFKFSSVDPTVVGGTVLDFLNVFDISEFYGDPSSVTTSQVLSDFSIFNDYVPYTLRSIQTGSFFDPIINLYSKLPDSFHYFGFLFNNTGVGFSIFFWVMLMISIVVFIICLILRRCRS